MDPFSVIGALAGAGGGIASALLGGESADEAAAWNYAIAQMNIEAQRKQQQNAMDYADKIRDEQHLGGTDALGNKTHFVPGQGWVVDLAPEQQALYDYFFQQELPEKRSQFQREAQSSRDNADVAGSLLDEFKRVQKDTPMDASNKLYLAATRGASEGERSTAEAALRQATRTGNSNIGNIIAKLGQASMKNRGDARLNADIQADDYVNDKFNSQRSGLTQLYQAFLGMANGNLSPSYDPTGLPKDANSLMNIFSNQAQQGNSMGFSAASAPAPQMDYVQPNNAWANAAGAIGQSLSGLGTRLGGMSQQSDMNDLLKEYISNGGQLSMSNGGIFGSMADRLRANGSGF